MNRDSAVATADYVRGELAELAPGLDDQGVYVVSVSADSTGSDEPGAVIIVVRRSGVEGDRQLRLRLAGPGSDAGDIARSVYQWFLEWPQDRFERLPRNPR